MFIFNVREESSVVRIFSDKMYRNGLTPENKDDVMYSLAREVLEQRALMDMGRRMHLLRRKCEGRRIDMFFLWSLKEAFDTKLRAHLVKGEDSESISSLMKHFTCGWLI